MLKSQLNLKSQQFEQNGYLVLKDFFSKEEAQLLRTRANEMVEEIDSTLSRVIFSTQHTAYLKNQYFLNSGHDVAFFFEEGAFNEEGESLREKALSINKIGHALHDIDPVFRSFSRSKKIANLVNELDIRNPLLLQSMYIFKQPFIGGEVNCHQDSTFLFVKGKPAVGFWFALEDATIDNACLWVLPGAHRGKLKSRLFRDENDHTYTEIYDASPWPLHEMIPLEVPQGTCIVLHGLLPHMSKTNTSAASRHAYTLHVFSGDDEYPENNWLRRPKTMPFQGF